MIGYGDTVTLDEKDKKILEILNKDARLSVAVISRITGIQRDSVLYRIKRMKKLKVIRFFHTVLNPSVLGYEIYSFVSLKLHNLSGSNEKNLLSFCQSHPTIVYVAKTTGKWDVVICVAAVNLQNFDEILQGLRVKFSNVIKEYETSPIIQEYKYDDMVGLA